MADLSILVTHTLHLFRRLGAKQCGALCHRIREDGQLEVLLITSRDTGRWVIPKGNIGSGEKAHKAAEREAREEAGIEGKAKKTPVGFYSYRKGGKKLCRVEVFLLAVDAVREDFPEKGQRRSAWLSPEDAALQVAEPELKNLIRLFGLQFQKSLYRRDRNSS